jgi:hypothetical protein
VIAAAAAFLVSCAAARGGFFSSADPGDVLRYHAFADLLRSHQLPYRDFYIEYPPGAIPWFLAPLLLSGVGYITAFKITIAVAGVALTIVVGVLLSLLARSPGRDVAVLGSLVVLPVALGAVVLNRYDLWPTLVLAAALAALLARRDRAAFALLGIGAAIKIFPLVVVPVAMVHVWRQRGSAALRSAVAWGIVAFVVVVLPFAALAPGGLGYSVKTQVIRKLQLESLGASFLLAADKLGVYAGSIVPGKPGSLDLSGGLPNALGVVTTLLFLVALAATVLAYVRAPESDELLVVGFAASVVAFVAFSKVVSPQFLVWLVPFVPLARGRRFLTTGLLVTIFVLTQIEVVWEHPLRRFGWPVWVLLGRNLLLVALFCVLLDALRREARLRLADQSAGEVDAA